MDIQDKFDYTITEEDEHAAKDNPEYWIDQADYEDSLIDRCDHCLNRNDKCTCFN